MIWDIARNNIPIIGLSLDGSVKCWNINVVILYVLNPSWYDFGSLTCGECKKTIWSKQKNALTLNF